MNTEKKQKFDALNAKRFRPSNYHEIMRDDNNGLVVWGSPDGLSAIGYKGRAIRHSFYIKFHSIERKTEYVESFIKAIQKRALENAEIRAERKAKVRGLEIGDVLISTWGFDQTNVDYYQVIALVAKNSVELRPINKNKTFDSNGDSGRCTPVIDSFCGDPFVKRVTNGVNVSFTSYISARKKNYELVDGKKHFSPDYWSSYA